MQYMRPAQLEAAAKAFPVVYVPFGLIEWHGRHLPLGTDALKAHAILVKTAEQFGGVVYPPVFYPSMRWNNGPIHPEDLERLVPMVDALFADLKRTGFRVIIGVSGHNIKEQILMIEHAVAKVSADGTVAGAGMWEVTLANSKEEAGTDHAAKWETSDMMYFYPDCVDLSTLGDREIVFNMKPPEGIGGADPRKHASPAVGERKATLCSAAIGAKARELLESLPPEHRVFGKAAIAPEHWWHV